MGQKPGEQLRLSEREEARCVYAAVQGVVDWEDWELDESAPPHIDKVGAMQGTLPLVSPLLPGPLEMLAITVICQYWTYSSYSSQPKQILNEKWINNEY